MEPSEPIDRIFQACEKPLLILAHQDDELGCTGILQRLQDRIHVVFMTNGDGLAPGEGKDPQRYAAMRKAEAQASLRTAGVPAERTRFLGYSEIEIYRNMARLRKSALGLSEVLAFMEPIRRSMSEIVYELRPDAVFAVAYQGGHPEHDLAHFFAALAVRNYERDAEARIPLYHFPEYELTNLIPMRFGPWYTGEKLWLELAEAELETKMKMAECYPSQKALIGEFRRVVTVLTLPHRLLRQRDPIARFFGREQLSPVPEGFDYRRAPYRLDFLNYMFEDFQSIPITFQDCIRPLVVAFQNAHGRRS